MLGYLRRNIVSIIILLTLVLCGYIAYLMINQNINTSKENQGYIRYLACMVDIRNSRAVVSVDNQSSEECWKKAEDSVGIKLTRYKDKE